MTRLIDFIKKIYIKLKLKTFYRNPIVYIAKIIRTYYHVEDDSTNIVAEFPMELYVGKNALFTLNKKDAIHLAWDNLVLEEQEEFMKKQEDPMIRIEALISKISLLETTRLEDYEFEPALGYSLPILHVKDKDYFYDEETKVYDLIGYRYGVRCKDPNDENTAYTFSKYESLKLNPHFSANPIVIRNFNNLIQIEQSNPDN